MPLNHSSSPAISSIFLAVFITACGGDSSSEAEITPTPIAPDTPVAPVNSAPVLTLTTTTVSIDSQGSTSIGVSATDADSDPLTYSLNNPPLISSEIIANQLIITAEEVQTQQVQNLTVSLFDGQITVEQTIEITINPLAQQSVLQLPQTPFNYAVIALPQHYTTNAFPSNFIFQTAAIESDNTPENNPISDHGATLGRVLFYDTKLSFNDTVSCASCHVQAEGFSDSRRLSIGFDGGETRRHSMSLANARFYQTGKFFWDERADTLEQQVLMPIQDEVEMGLTLTQLVDVVAAQPYYNSLFINAFGDDEVSSERISFALSQFIRAMVSIDAKYDQGRLTVNNPLDNFSNFSVDENAGKRLFMQFRDGIPPCTSCHSSEAFVGPLIGEDSNATTSASNNGLDANSDSDQGVFESTGAMGHRGKFKSPSLKNIGVTAPYMHDGRFDTLAEVVEHYSSGIEAHPTLQALLKDADGNPVRYNFSATEQAQLVAFLETLTDETLLTDEKFSDPFVR